VGTEHTPRLGHTVTQIDRPVLTCLARDLYGPLLGTDEAGGTGTAMRLEEGTMGKPDRPDNG